MGGERLSSVAGPAGPGGLGEIFCYRWGLVQGVWALRGRAGWKCPHDNEEGASPPGGAEKILGTKREVRQ